MLHTYPPIVKHVQPWDLPLVLRALTRSPFWACIIMWHKTLVMEDLVFSGNHFGNHFVEHQWTTRPPFLSFLPRAIRLSTNVTFVPKVLFEFHMNSTIILLDFYPNPVSPQERLYQTLDVTRAVKFYLHRTKFPNTDDALFVSYLGRTLGRKVTSQHLSKWKIVIISLCYSLSEVPLPSSFTAHSMRAMATLTAFSQAVSLDEICRAAKW